MRKLLTDTLMVGLLHSMIFLLLLKLGAYINTWFIILSPIYLIYVIYHIELKFRFYIKKQKQRYIIGILSVFIAEIIRIYFINS